MSTNPQTRTEIPEGFIEQIKEALEHLYDFPALQRNPLAKALEVHEDATPLSGAHRLRRKLIEAIEELSPGQDIAAHSGAARIYNLVYQHYVGGMTLQEASLEVGLSLRQAYRDLRRGQEHVSAILWYSQETSKATPETAHLSSIKTEITRLEGGITTVPLQKMLESALRAVQKLAAQNGITLDVQVAQADGIITTNPVIAQQVLTHIFSQVIQQIAPLEMHVSVEERGGGFQIILSYSGQDDIQQKPRIEPIIEQMMRQIRWKMAFRTVADDQQLIIQSAQEGALLLLIDDNQGLVDLLDQYLSDNAYRVVAVHNGEDGLRMAQQLLPDAIILDLMMPGMDGWEVLQRLRTSVGTQTIPVIICSVINDPELAYSLGASKFVAKPVTRETILDAVRELNI